VPLKAKSSELNQVSKRHHQGSGETSRCKDRGSGDEEGGVSEVVLGVGCQAQGVEEGSAATSGRGIRRGERRERRDGHRAVRHLPELRGKGSEEGMREIPQVCYPAWRNSPCRDVLQEITPPFKDIK